MADVRVILVVEDEFLLRLYAVGLLEDAGFAVLQAENADDAIAILENRSDVGLVFTDIMMPGTMDGLKLVHYIRQRWPPVQLMVASGQAIVAESALPEGARFFTKPYGQRTIVETANSLFLAAPGAGSA